MVRGATQDFLILLVRLDLTLANGLCLIQILFHHPELYGQVKTTVGVLLVLQIMLFIQVRLLSMHHEAIVSTANQQQYSHLHSMYICGGGQHEHAKR